MPAAAETVGLIWPLQDTATHCRPCGEGLRPFARAHRIALHPLDAKHPAIRETLRGIARTHSEPGRRSAALATAEIKRLAGVCGDDFAGVRDRALLLIGFAGAQSWCRSTSNMCGRTRRASG